MAARKSKRRGRPPKPKRSKQTERLGFFVSTKDRRTVERVARRVGKTVPEFIASVVRREVRRLEETDLESARKLTECDVCEAACDADAEVRYGDMLREASEEAGDLVVSVDFAGQDYWNDALESLFPNLNPDVLCGSCLKQVSDESWRLRNGDE